MYALPQSQIRRSFKNYLQVSYGLVLNLLSVYSLQEAHEFCDRSFGNYLKVGGLVSVGGRRLSSGD